MTAVDNLWQLIQKKIYWIFYVHTWVETCAKFWLSRLILIFVNCYQLTWAVDSWWQQIWKKIDMTFFVHTKVDTCFEFQLSRLIFTFISCQQLLSAVDSWWQLLRKTSGNHKSCTCLIDLKKRFYHEGKIHKFS